MIGGGDAESIEDLLMAGFLAVVIFGSSPTPSPVSELYRLHTGRQRKRDNLFSGWGWTG
jgi:hypothetical protein